MISLQYIPLSVRVRSWNISLFSQDELVSFINEDINIIMSAVAKKEKHFIIDTSSSKKFIHSVQDSFLEYLNIALLISSGISKKLVKELFHEFEIINLKNVVRMLISGKFQHTFYPYIATQKLSIIKLSEIRTFSELSHILEDTPYYIFVPILEQVQQEKNSLYWELALDNYYANIINNFSRCMDMNSRKAVTKMLLLPLLHERIISLYRYLFHYNVDPVNALNYISHLSSLISLDNWKTLVFSSSKDDFHNHLVTMGYISEDIPNYASALRMEFQRQLENKCRKMIHKNLTSIESFLAFIQLKRIQYQKLTTILEAKSLSVNHADIMQFL